MLAPYLQDEYHWSNFDFAIIVTSFRVSYAVVQLIGGHLVDVVGTRRGLGIAVAWYSVMAMLTSSANGLGSFCAFRFLLGAGEAANWPARPRPSPNGSLPRSEPSRLRYSTAAPRSAGRSRHACGVALSRVRHLAARVSDHRLARLSLANCVDGDYHRPEDHPLISDSELDMIRKSRSGADEALAPTRVSVLTLATYRQTWGVVLAKAILDPYWFLVADWFALFLVSRGFKLQETLLGFWIPFVCADLGNFVGGGLSSYFVHRGWSVGAARRIIFLICGPLMLLLIPAVYTTNLWLLIAEFGLATLGYAACATIFLTLPSDLFDSGSVATVSGLAGMVTGFVTIAVTLTIGVVTDKYSFAPILMGASAAPVLAAIAVFTLVRNTQNTGNGVLLGI